MTIPTDPATRAHGAAVAEAESLGAVVTDEASGQSFVVPEGRTLLEAALAQGVELRFGCRVGVCGACAVEVTEGLPGASPPDAIERNTLDRYGMGPRVRLACRARTCGRLRVKPA